MRMLMFIQFVIIQTVCFSQDCSTLDNFNSFKGVRFGQAIPDSIRYSFSADTARGEITYTLYFLQTQLFDSCKSFKKFFYLGDGFSRVSFTTSLDGILYSVTLKGYENYKAPVLFKKNSTEQYDNVLFEIETMFGKPSTPSVKISDTENVFCTMWDCYKKTIKWYIGLKKENKEATYLLIIEDNEAKRRAKLKGYSN